MVEMDNEPSLDTDCVGGGAGGGDGLRGGVGGGTGSRFRRVKAESEFNSGHVDCFMQFL